MTLVRQFIVFGTNNADAGQAGIERSLRFIQALVSLLATYPALQATALLSPRSTSIPPPTSFLQLRAKINVTRRLLRIFRFLEYFRLGWDLYSSDILDFETWLDVLGKTCLGIFGMLESVTLLDLLEIDQLEIFGTEQTVMLNYQAQFFWLTALCISLFRSSTRLLRLLGNRAATDASLGQDAASRKEEGERQNGDGLPTGNDDSSVPREPKGKQQNGSGHQMETKSRAGEPEEAVSSLIMKLTSDAMDLLLPATAVGLVEVHPAVIAMTMIVSTAITARDVWARCGKDMRRR
ncbi:AoPex11B [Trichoderma cornu-damae]|uniref:AoPex11B n=1 Tax=Trichoderma cornu-damae TaxID=654480 RepID=A0A9P8QPC1_9HYPO|nr:AoPex11B [Trichoderma cornu-damae]